MDRRTSTVKRALKQVARNFSAHNVGKSAAALTYYLLFALFPLMIFLSNLLGLLDIDTASVAQTLYAFMPRDVVDLLTSYLEHVSQTSSQSLLWFSLVFTVWFPLRAVRGLMDDVRLAFQLGKPKKPVKFAIRQLVFTVLFLVMIVMTLLLSVLGQRVVELICGWIPGLQRLEEMEFFLSLWQYLRFVIAAMVMFAAVGLLYAASQDSPQPFRRFLPGVAVALGGWLVASVGFSFYVESMGRYSVIYGTLGAVIVLLVWLYLTATMLILGAEFNAALIQTDSRPSPSKEAPLF